MDVQRFKFLKVGGDLFIQSIFGSVPIRDFVFDFVIDGYRGNEHYRFIQAHLFEGYQIVDWAYQKVPGLDYLGCAIGRSFALLHLYQRTTNLSLGTS